MEGMGECFVAKELGDVFGGNPVLETTKISLAQRWGVSLDLRSSQIFRPDTTGKDTFLSKNRSGDFVGQHP